MILSNCAERFLVNVVFVQENEDKGSNIQFCTAVQDMRSMICLLPRQSLQVSFRRQGYEAFVLFVFVPDLFAGLLIPSIQSWILKMFWLA